MNELNNTVNAVGNYNRYNWHYINNLCSRQFTIGGIKASASEYSYDTDSHTLTVKLPSVIARTSSIVTFQVKKTWRIPHLKKLRNI